VNERLRAIAPFLRFESKPYLVTARVDDDPDYRSDHHQYWLLDGFTQSRSYPYSDANPEGIRYFRNPVKAVSRCLQRGCLALRERPNGSRAAHLAEGVP